MLFFAEKFGKFTEGGGKFVVKYLLKNNFYEKAFNFSGCFTYNG